MDEGMGRADASGEKLKAHRFCCRQGPDRPIGYHPDTAEGGKDGRVTEAIEIVNDSLESETRPATTQPAVTQPSERQ